MRFTCYKNYYEWILFPTLKVSTDIHTVTFCWLRWEVGLDYEEDIKCRKK